MRRPAKSVLFLTALMTLSLACTRNDGSRLGNSHRPVGRAELPPAFGSVAGRVIDPAGQPLASAEVSVVGDAWKQYWPGAVLTNGDGAFVIERLLPGRYRVRCEKAGLASAEWGRAQPFARSREVLVSPGEHVDGIECRLDIGGVITGRIVDERGEPVARASVDATHLVSGPHGRSLFPLSYPGMTDDRGLYRLYGLGPGAHVLRIWPSQSFAASDDRSRRGRTHLYFPGTPDLDKAESIDVQRGRETALSDFVLRTVEMTHVSGTVERSDGKSFRGGVSVYEKRAGFISGFIAASGQLTPDGRLELDVPPGSYQMLVTTTEMPPTARKTFPEQGHEWALMPLQVGNLPIEGLRVSTSTGSRATGRIVFERDELDRPALESTWITALSIHVVYPYTTPFTTRVGPDWSFDIGGLVGSRVLGAAASDGWTVASVTHRGIDMTETPFTFDGNNRIDGVEIALTKRAALLDVSAHDGRGAPTASFTSFVFPADPARWDAAGLLLFDAYGGVATERRFGKPLSYRIRVQPSDQHGHAIHDAMPPGEYLAIAIPPIDEAEQVDVIMLRDLARSATRVTLAPWQRQAVSLPLVRRPD